MRKSFSPFKSSTSGQDYYSSVTFERTTLLFFLGASPSSTCLFPDPAVSVLAADPDAVPLPVPTLALTLAPDSDSDARRGNAKPSFSSLGVGRAGSTELVELDGGNDAGGTRPCPICAGGGGTAIDDAFDPSRSLRAGAGDCRVVVDIDTAGEWGIGVEVDDDGMG